MITLQRYDQARNLARYYHLSVEANLFGEWSLVRAWGRIGRTCQMQVDLWTSREAAEAALERKAREKRQKGYA